ncbi:MAG TPA: hypothetical protein VNN17_12810 [Terriglobia bacterium]|nr:hypothetical protein [Terriglobia bacterium]
MTGGRAYDSEQLDQRLLENYATEIIAPHNVGRVNRPARMAGPCAATGAAGKSSESSPGCITLAGSEPAGNPLPKNFLALLQRACTLILRRRL